MNWSKLREVEEENFTRWTAHCWLIIRRISKRKKKRIGNIIKIRKRKSLASIITFEYTHTSVSNLYQRMAGYPSILSNAKNSKEKDKREGESIPWLVWRKNATRLSFSPTEANSSPFMFHIYCYWPAVIVTKYIELKLRMRVIYIYIYVFSLERIFTKFRDGIIESSSFINPKKLNSIQIGNVETFHRDEHSTKLSSIVCIVNLVQYCSRYVHSYHWCSIGWKFIIIRIKNRDIFFFFFSLHCEMGIPGRHGFLDQVVFWCTIERESSLCRWVLWLSHSIWY